MKKIKYLFVISLLAIAFSCESDDPQDLNEKSTTVEAANKLLSGEMVLSTHVKMGTVDKSLLPEGCPTKFYFKWEEEKQKLYVRLPKFTVGAMPFSVMFYCDATYMELNKWEKDEYPEKDWIKFYADNGVVFPYVPEGEEKPVAEGAAILTGYVNPRLEEIEFVVNYNMMNVISHCFRQKIDKSRLENYEEEFKQYEEDLKKYKEEHGL